LDTNYHPKISIYPIDICGETFKMSLDIYVVTLWGNFKLPFLNFLFLLVKTHLTNWCLV